MELTQINSPLCTQNGISQTFLIKYLETGQGVTIGSALRRTMLSDLTGYAITGLRVNTIKHEFEAVTGLREDILELILNLKQLKFQGLSSFKAPELITIGKISEKGPKLITGRMLLLKEKKIKLLNPSEYICTIADNSPLNIAVDIELGKGYRPANEKPALLKEQAPNAYQAQIPETLGPSTLCLDANFMPVKTVNFKVNVIRDDSFNLKESLTMHVVTNGSISPKRSIVEATKLILDMFYPLLLSPGFLKTSLDVSSKIIS